MIYSIEQINKKNKNTTFQLELIGANKYIPTYYIFCNTSKLF